MATADLAIRCPKCKEAFRPGRDAADTDGEDAKLDEGYSLKPNLPAKPSRAKPAPAVANDDDDEDRPAPRRSRYDADDDSDEDLEAPPRRRADREQEDSFDEPARRIHLPGVKRAILLSVLLLAHAPVALVLSGFEFKIFLVFKDKLPPDMQLLEFYEPVETRLFITHWVFVLVNFIVFLTWFHRAYANLSLTRATGLEHSPGGAVGWFFVPFVGLYLPCVIAQEIWKASKPSAIGSSWRGEDGSNLIGLWWICHVGALLLNELGRRLLVVSGGQVTSTLFTIVCICAVVSYLLFFGGGVFLFFVVRGVMRRQYRKLWLIKNPAR